MDAIYFYTRSEALEKVLEHTRFDYQRLQEVRDNQRSRGASKCHSSKTRQFDLLHKGLHYLE